MFELRIDLSQIRQLADDLGVARDQIPFAAARVMNALRCGSHCLIRARHASTRAVGVTRRALTWADASASVRLVGS